MEPRAPDPSSQRPATTRQAQPVKASPFAPATVPLLTVLYHPDIRRVGDRMLLSELLAGREALVSRTKPDFAPPGRLAGQPLDDPYLSREPIRFAALPDDGVVLTVSPSRTPVTIGGERIGESRRFGAAELAEGVVLELAERIVLLLQRVTLAREDESPGDSRFGLIGDSPAMVRLRAEIRRVADLDVPVLLRGATGTGKELSARAIHHAGPRRAHDFLAVNLGAIPPSLAASELFGAVKGAFTGSVQSQEGYFRRADGGTLFLDEVGEAPPEVQVMLLRVLETSEVFAVGSQQARRVDVRLVAATDADLERAAREGGFREPLLHRLAGYEIRLPTLRQRRDDIGRLLVHFLREEVAQLGEGDPFAGDATARLPAALVARLARFHWPGNVRQLRNVARQLAIGSRGRARIELGPRLELLLDRTAHDSAPDAESLAASEPAQPTATAYRHPADVSDEELVAALRRQRFDLKAVAAALNVSRTSLYTLIERSPRARLARDLTAAEVAAAQRDTGGDLDAMVERLEVSKAALRRRLRELGLGQRPQV